MREALRATSGPHDSYLSDPAAIYAESFRQVRAATDLRRLPSTLHDVALRMVHACALPDIVHDIAWSGELTSTACCALGDGAPVLVDAEMVKAGIVAGRLPHNNALRCTLNAPGIAATAQALGITRSAAAVDSWRDAIAGAVVVIGNAPTALFRLLEHLRAGWPHPAAIIALPIGFVGAAESKQALINADLDITYLTLKGRFGGSALAAAALNAVLLAER